MLTCNQDDFLSLSANTRKELSDRFGGCLLYVPTLIVQYKAVKEHYDYHREHLQLTHREAVTALSFYFGFKERRIKRILKRYSEIEQQIEELSEKS